LFKRNDKKNRKGTLTPKMPFAARFSCCATIDCNSILKYFSRGCGGPLLKEENHYTFRTIPREHWLMEVSMARPN